MLLLRKYIIKRSLRLIPSLVGTMVVLYFMFALMPADIANYYFPLTMEQKAKLRHELNLDQPKIVQFKIWMSQAARGDLGKSFASGNPVSSMVNHGIQTTLKLTVPAFLIGIFLSIPLGVIGAVHWRKTRGKLIDALSMFGLCVPPIFLAFIFTLVFCFKLEWLPLPGPVMESWQARKFHSPIYWYIAPVFVLALYNTGLFTRFLRTTLIDILSHDYINTARSKGIKEKVVIYKHALRNSLIPFVTVIGTNIPLIFAGSAIIERYYRFPGLGNMMLNGIFQRDYAILMGIYLIITIATLLSNFLTDIVYGIVDPRVRVDR